jgi:GR25 family glycosyltransferase involved in LPS biosynthesis
MDSIGKVYYINLEHRKDRNTHMETWLQESGVPADTIERIDAVYKPEKGYLGCTASHIKALEAFLQSGHNVCCIYEDDYKPVQKETYWTDVQKVFDAKVEFDLVMLAYNGIQPQETEHPFLVKTRCAQTTSGYMITRKFAPILLANFKEALQFGLEEEATTHQKAVQYCLDVYWWKLIPISKWYIFTPRLGFQMESYSDIENRVTNYRV